MYLRAVEDFKRHPVLVRIAPYHCESAFMRVMIPSSGITGLNWKNTQQVEIDTAVA